MATPDEGLAVARKRLPTTAMASPEVLMDQASPERVSWIEIRLDASGQLQAVYTAADAAKSESIHHFNFEPWWPQGPVVRIAGKAEGIAQVRGELAQTTPTAEIVEWDAGPDERLYGHRWPEVSSFFEAASRMALTRPDRELLLKAIHCVLNAHALNVVEEFRFALTFAHERFMLVSSLIGQDLGAESGTGSPEE